MSSGDVSWVPLSVRMGLREPFKPAKGVPDYLYRSLLDWINTVTWTLKEKERSAFEQTCELRLHAPNFNLESLFRGDYRNSEELLLDVVDLLLFFWGSAEMDMGPAHGRVASGDALEKVLRLVSHEYRLDASKERLVKRVDDTAWASYEHAMSAEDEASELIASAWAKQYSRSPDFAGAWEDANKAVLVALRPIASPKNSKATLSKLAREIREGEEKFEADLPGSELESSVLQFARALEIVGYPDNHHDGSTVDSRRSATAVLQAVTVVGWLRDGAFRRVQE